ncbi:hypothetical protein GIB67_030949 [Kingdonia uniflora]|uniref:Uncharacterized protein n=1 Tax=Kingdonia uniflora TaxID=39325 RepID=A0A7J7L3I9_9MAGN|nr:hypothetical protein GIB67_030949 [Kingdonia uniflora]
MKGVIPTVNRNSRWLIGNDSNIDFWRNCWGADHPLINSVEVDPAIWGSCSVKLDSIIDNNGWCAPPLVTEFLADNGIVLTIWMSIEI